MHLLLTDGQKLPLDFTKEPFGGYTVTLAAIPSFTCYGETHDEAFVRFNGVIEAALAEAGLPPSAAVEWPGEYDELWRRFMRWRPT